MKRLKKIDAVDLVYSVDKLSPLEKIKLILERPEAFNLFKVQAPMWWIQYNIEDRHSNLTKIETSLGYLFNQPNKYILTVLKTLLPKHFNKKEFSRENPEISFKYDLSVLLDTPIIKILCKFLNQKRFYFHEFIETDTLYLLYATEIHILNVDYLPKDKELYDNYVNNYNIYNDIPAIYCQVNLPVFYLNRRHIPDHISYTLPILITKFPFLADLVKLTFRRFTYSQLMSEKRKQTVVKLVQDIPRLHLKDALTLTYHTLPLELEQLMETDPYLKELSSEFLTHSGCPARFSKIGYCESVIKKKIKNQEFIDLLFI